MKGKIIMVATVKPFGNGAHILLSEYRKITGRPATELIGKRVTIIIDEY